MIDDTQDRFRGCLLGLAVGDAVGTTVEFMQRGSFEPVTDMVGGGPFELKPGQWTDDTSMALCLGQSLLNCDGFDPVDQLKNYEEWYRNGYMSSNGLCFDIGNTTRYAITRFGQTGKSYCGLIDPKYAGNGCIMRLAPLPMFYYESPYKLDKYAPLSSRTTHGAPECLNATTLFAEILVRALHGDEWWTKDKILFLHDYTILEEPSIRGIANGEYKDKSRDEISGSGYVVESLEAALWCFWNTENFKDAILMAVNLGDDADTTAAITGQIAGAFYGMSDIPTDWLQKLSHHDMILDMADKLHEKGIIRGS